MAKLILSMDGLVLKEILLDKERLTIGRKPQNDIQIDNLAISGEHAVVVTILADSFLEDLNSTNGTQVNGQAVKRHFLRHNDIIELGKYKLKYLADNGVTAAGHDTEPAIKNKVIAQARPAELQLEAVPDVRKPVAPAAPVATPRAEGLPVAAIQLLSGPNAGKQLDLQKTLTTLGKPGVQVAVIAKRPHGYFITHVEGDEFPSVNGRAIDAQARALNDHDVIELAGIKMEFFHKP
ncbi:MAG: FHA domain-containing protein [Azonexus sp.]|nr:FHA domain-containing protein [Azonexus sp.]